MTNETAVANLTKAAEHLKTLYGTSTIPMTSGHSELRVADLEESITTLELAAGQ